MISLPKIDLKLWRDIAHMKAQIVTIALVVAVGIANLIGMLGTYESLNLALESFYNSSNFAHAFAELKRAPIRQAQVISHIPGVSYLEHRLVFDQIVDLPGKVEPAVGRFVSLPKFGRANINKLHLKEGRWPLATSNNEVLVSEAFFKANNLKVSQKFSAMFNGRYRQLTIAGVVVSPEYIYTLSGAIPMPDDKHFGIMWIAREALSASYDMDGAFNSLTMRLNNNVNPREVVERIDLALKPYGGVGAITREKQISNFFLQNEIKQLKIQAVFVPFIFLSVAAFLLNVVLSRMVSSQREQIATLKAVGYSDKSIGLHFFKFAFVITTIGAIIGVIGGFFYSQAMTELYTLFFRFPLLVHVTPPYLPMMALLISFVAAALGVVTGLLKIFKLTPAEAMRPPSPPSYHSGVMEALGIIEKLKIQMRMIFRGLNQRPLRSFLTSVGVSFALMIVMMGMFWQDSLDHLIHVQYGLVQKEDVAVQFIGQTKLQALNDLQNLEGIRWAEGSRSVPVKVKRRNISENLGLLGLPPNAKLRKLLSEDLENILLQPGEFAISGNLARKFKVQAGDHLVVEVLEGNKREKSIPISRVVDDFMGMSIYALRPTVNEFMGEGPLINSASLTISPVDRSLLYTKLKNIPQIASISFKDSVLSLFNETSAKFIIVFASFLTLFSMVIAFGIVYNSARISLAERDWELASLRILGFSNFEVFVILMGELSVLMVAAIPLGWAFGHYANYLMMSAAMPENMTFPFHIEPSTYTWSAMVLIVSGVISAWVIYRRVVKLDFNAALKARG